MSMATIAEFDCHVRQKTEQHPNLVPAKFFAIQDTMDVLFSSSIAQEYLGRVQSVRDCPASALSPRCEASNSADLVRSDVP